MASKIEVLTQATVEKGGTLAMLYFDMHGPDKAKLEQLLVDLANRLNDEKGVVYSVGEIDRAMELGDQFSAAAKITILTSSFAVLSRICDRFGPMGVEILKPNEIHLSIPDAQQVLFDHVKMMSDLLREMIEKNMTPEERKKLGKLMEARAELGKDMIQKGESAPAPKKDDGK